MVSLPFCLPRWLVGSPALPRPFARTGPCGATTRTAARPRPTSSRPRCTCSGSARGRVRAPPRASTCGCVSTCRTSRSSWARPCSCHRWSRTASQRSTRPRGPSGGRSLPTGRCGSRRSRGGGKRISCRMTAASIACARPTASGCGRCGARRTDGATTSSWATSVWCRGGRPSAARCWPRATSTSRQASGRARGSTSARSTPKPASCGGATPRAASWTPG